MQLNVFRTLWGVTTPWQQTVSELRSVGCCGIEARVPLTPEEQRTLAQRIEASALEYIAIVFSGGGVIPAQAETPAQHLERLKERFAAAKALNPRFVNLLAGNDRWPLAQQVDFLGRAHELAAEYELFCSFETHRATSLYSPWLTLEIIPQLPQLRFTADISHWIVVSERLLDDPCDDFSAFIERVHHIQARAGYDQGRRCRTPPRRNIGRPCGFSSASGNRSGNRSAGAATSTPRLRRNLAPMATCITCRLPTFRSPTCGR